MATPFLQQLETDCQEHTLLDHAAIGLHPSTGKAMDYHQFITGQTTKQDWLLLAANEFSRLALGVRSCVEGTTTVFFLPRHKIPQNKNFTYAHFVCDYHPCKSEPNPTCNLIEYPHDLSTHTTDLPTVKCHLNSTISTPAAKYMSVNVRNFYLGTPLDQYEYLHIPLHLIPLKSSNNTIYIISWVTRTINMWKYAKECVACPKPAF